MQSRRSLLRAALVITGAAVLSGCGRRVADGTTEDFLGDAHAAGDPVWSERPPSYVVAYTVAQRARLRRSQPAALLETITGGLAALSPECPNDGTTVGYCTGERLFVCPTCASAFDRWGHVVDGPAMRGLAHRPVELRAGELVVQGGSTVPGPVAGTTRPDGATDRIVGAAGRCTGAITMPPSITGGAA